MTMMITLFFCMNEWALERQDFPKHTEALSLLCLSAQSLHPRLHVARSHDDDNDSVEDDKTFVLRVR